MDLEWIRDISDTELIEIYRSLLDFIQYLDKEVDKVEEMNE